MSGQLGFSETHKFGNIGINANFILPYWQFFLYLHQHDVVNVILNISGHMIITFKSCKQHWSR